MILKLAKDLLRHLFLFKIFFNSIYLCFYFVILYWFCHTSLMGCTEGVFPASLEASPGPNSALDLGYTRSQLPPASLFKDTFLPGGLPATA